MNQRDLHEAYLLAGTLNGEQQIIAKNLAARIRSTGLVSTSRWLADSKGGQTLTARFHVQGLANMSTPDRIRRQREALRLAEALHLVLRNKTGSR